MRIDPDLRRADGARPALHEIVAPVIEACTAAGLRNAELWHSGGGIMCVRADARRGGGCVVIGDGANGGGFDEEWTRRDGFGVDYLDAGGDSIAHGTYGLLADLERALLAWHLDELQVHA